MPVSRLDLPWRQPAEMKIARITRRRLTYLHLSAGTSAADIVMRKVKKCPTVGYRTAVHGDRYL